MLVNGFKFQLPVIFLYFPANIDILVCTNTKCVEGVTWDMEGWLGLPLEEHWGASVLLTAPLLVILPPWLLQLHTSDQIITSSPFYIHQCAVFCSAGPMLILADGWSCLCCTQPPQ